MVFMAKVLKHYVNDNELYGRIENEHFVLLKEYDKKSLHNDLDIIVKTVKTIPSGKYESLWLRFGILSY